MHWGEELTHWKRLWCWEGLGAGGEGDDGGWDGWMASPTRWTWVSVNSGSWCWTGRPGVLRFMGLQRVGHDWATDLIWSEVKKWSESHSVMSNSLQPRGLSPWNFPDQNTGVGSLSLLQGVFPTQGSNPGLPHCRQILYQLSHKGSPRILEWVAYPFSRGSSWPRNWTRVSCIASGFFTNWAMIRKARTVF